MSDDKNLILEVTKFEYDNSLLKESFDNPDKPFLVKGILQRAGAKNQNERVYPKPLLEREVEKYIDQFIKENRAMGELDHSNCEVINLKNVSHNIVEMHWDGDDLVGTIEILPTPNGEILKTLFRKNIRIGISSRGVGSVKKITESLFHVQDNFNLICFDFVSNPSTQGAFMFPMQSIVKENVEYIKNPFKNKWEGVNSIIRDIFGELS